MRILQIVPSVSLIYGGPSQMVLGLSKALAQQDVEVTLLTTNSNGDTGQAPLEVPLNQPMEQDGYQIRYFPCSPFRRYKFSLGLLQWLFHHGKQYDLAHIHALFSPVSTAAATLARYQKLPYLLRPLGTLDPADLQKKKQLKKIYGNLLERPNLAQAAGIHFTSEQEAKISERYGTHSRDIIIPLGVEPPNPLPEAGKIRHQLGISPQQPLLLFMSRIDPKKGLDLLLPALENLATEGQDFHFVLAGSNPQDPAYEAQIRRQIEYSALGKRTTITGFIQGEMKRGLLQDADLFVLPSYYENFGIAVAEALNLGTPVVISDQVHICQEIQAAKAGWLCSCTVDSLQKKLQVALGNSHERQQRGKHARQLVEEKYTWTAIAHQMIRAYDTVINT